jgi:hypothetical protein
MRRAVVTVFLAGFSALGNAQQLSTTGSGSAFFESTPDSSKVAIVSYEFQVYRPGVDPTAGEPFRQVTIPSSNVACDQSPIVAPPVSINPSRVVWDDPDHPGRLCAVSLTMLSELPIAPDAYLATLTAYTEAGAGASSAPSNIFFRISARRVGW